MSNDDPYAITSTAFSVFLYAVVSRLRALAPTSALRKETARLTCLHLEDAASRGSMVTPADHAALRQMRRSLEKMIEYLASDPPIPKLP